MNTKICEVIRKCMGSLRRCFSYEDCNKILIYIFFLKYIIDNKKIPLNDETFEIFLDSQRMLDKYEFDKDIVTKFNYIIENSLDIPSGSLSDFSNLYFVMSELKKVQNVDIFTCLSEISFENQSEEIIAALKESLWDSAESFGRIVGNFLSNKSLSKLSKELLEINDDDIFADLAYGLGVSSMEITEDVNCSLVGYEIDKETCSLAQMLIIISGKEKCKLYNEDSTIADVGDAVFDKIVIHPPLNMKIRELEREQKNLLEEFMLPARPTSIEVLVALRAIKALKTNGRIVMAVSPNVLFSATMVEKNFRKLIARKYLSSVIVTPPLYYGTGTPSVLITLEEKRTSNEIQFLDINNNEFFSRINTKIKAPNEITDDMIYKLIEIIKTKQEIPAIAKVVQLDTVEENDFLLSPAKYLQERKEKETIPNIEIDKKLRVLYDEIKEMID